MNLRVCFCFKYFVCCMVKLRSLSLRCCQIYETQTTTTDTYLLATLEQAGHLFCAYPLVSPHFDEDYVDTYGFAES